MVIKLLENFVYPILKYEFQYAMDGYLKSQNNPEIPQSLKEIIEYNKANSEIAIKYGQGTLIAAGEISSNWKNEQVYIDALKERETVKNALKQLFDSAGIDVLILFSAHYGLPASVGFPSITIPIGKTDKGMPIGTCMLARPFDEETLLTVAKLIKCPK